MCVGRYICIMKSFVELFCQKFVKEFQGRGTLLFGGGNSADGFAVKLVVMFWHSMCAKVVQQSQDGR